MFTVYMDYNAELSLNDYIIMYSGDKYNISIPNLSKTDSIQKLSTCREQTQTSESKISEDLKSKLSLTNHKNV